MSKTIEETNRTLNNMYDYYERVVNKARQGARKVNKKTQTSIRELNLSPSIIKWILEDGVTTVEELEDTSAIFWYSIRNIGPMRVQKIKQAIRELRQNS